MDEFRGDSVIDEDVVRAQLRGLVEANCCWGDAPAKDMTLQEILPMPALHYTIESFTEARTTQVNLGQMRSTLYIFVSTRYFFES